MKKIVLTLLIFVLPVAFAFSQKDQKAKEVLDKSSQKYSDAGGISAYFTLNIKDVKNKVTESFDGNILMKNEKFYLSTPDADTWFDGKTQWVYLKGPEEVNVSEPSGRDLQMINPAAIFTIYKTGSNYKYTGEKNDIKNRPVYEVELIPENKKADITKIILQVNKSDYIPVMFRIIYKNNLENIVYINKYQINQTFQDNTFVFDKKKYPKAEIIDLR